LDIGLIFPIAEISEIVEELVIFEILVECKMVDVERICQELDEFELPCETELEGGFLWKGESVWWCGGGGGGGGHDCARVSDEW